MSLITKVFLFYNELSLIQMQKRRFSNGKESSMLRKSAMLTKPIIMRTPI